MLCATPQTDTPRLGRSATVADFEPKVGEVSKRPSSGGPETRYGTGVDEPRPTPEDVLLLRHAGLMRVAATDHVVITGARKAATIVRIVRGQDSAPAEPKVGIASVIGQQAPGGGAQPAKRSHVTQVIAVDEMNRQTEVELW